MFGPKCLGLNAGPMGLILGFQSRYFFSVQALATASYLPLLKELDSVEYGSGPSILPYNILCLRRQLSAVLLSFIVVSIEIERKRILRKERMLIFTRKKREDALLRYQYDVGQS